MDASNSPKSCVVLFSGGMDSTVVLYHAIRNYDIITALLIDYGQRNATEIAVASNTIVSLLDKEQKSIGFQKIEVPLKSIGFKSALTQTDIAVPKMKEVIGDPQNDAYVPNRNMIFLSLAVGMAESCNTDTVLYGAAKADDTSGFWDCTLGFRNRLNTILSLNRRNQIKIEAPLIEKTKKEIIEYGVELGVDFTKTRTCYTEHLQACGECPSCSARLAGFVQAKLIDPINYSRKIDWSKYNCVEIK